jgi:ankyrin repeat protein
MWGEGSYRPSLFRLIPALMLLCFVAWCSSSRQSRGGVDGPLHVSEAVPSLHKLAKKPQFDRLEYFLNQGLDATQRGGEGRSLMHVCAEAGMDERVFALLRSKGLGTADSTPAGKQPIHEASVKSLSVLVAGGADLAAVDNKGQTAPHIAAAAGRQDLVTELLRFGASVFAADKEGRTPLHWAALSRSEPSVDALLARSAPRTARDNGGLTPRDLAESERPRAYRNEREQLRDNL